MYHNIRIYLKYFKHHYDNFITKLLTISNIQIAHRFNMIKNGHSSIFDETKINYDNNGILQLYMTIDIYGPRNIRITSMNIDIVTGCILPITFNGIVGHVTDNNVDSILNLLTMSNETNQTHLFPLHQHYPKFPKFNNEDHPNINSCLEKYKTFSTVNLIWEKMAYEELWAITHRLMGHFLTYGFDGILCNTMLI